MVRLELDLKQKYYANAQQAALGEIRASIPESQFVALVGPSGTGKTTLLNMIAGLEPSEAAAIRINSEPVSANSVKQQAPCKLGYIFQQPRLLPWMTVEQNLSLTASDASQSDIESMLDIVGLQGKGGEFPRKLSGGMQKRVSIARAFLAKPDLLLLDEPFVSLDQPTAQHLRGMLENLWQRQKPTVVFVTHDLHEAIQLADRILFLSAAPGGLILDQTVELPRPRGGIEVEEWKRALLAEHPDVLAGK